MSKVKQPWVVALVLLLLAAAAAVVTNIPVSAVGYVTGGVNYLVDPDWPKLPPGRPEPLRLERRIGYMHGDVAVSSSGEVYVSVQSMWYVNLYLNGRQVNADMGLPPEYLDPYAGLQVYADDGRYPAQRTQCAHGLARLHHQQRGGWGIHLRRASRGHKCATGSVQSRLVQAGRCEDDPRRQDGHDHPGDGVSRSI